MEIDYEQIRATFTAETEEDLATVEQALLQLEKSPEDRDCVALVFRKFHTLKGGATTLGLTKLGGLAHALEDLLDRLRAGLDPVTPAVITYLLQAVDCIRRALPDAAAGLDVLPPLSEALLSRIEGGRFQETAEAAGDGERDLELASEATLRIDVGRLDQLLSVSSEIAIARGRLRLLIEGQGAPEIAAAYHSLERLLTGMHHSVSKVRMVPIGPLLRRYARVVRDVAVAFHKEAELIVSDQGVEVDNSLIEQLKAPLMHMVRNAVHHGLETPEVRERAGKARRGRVELRARHEGGDIVIEVEDDGAGLERARIVERARALGLASEAGTLGDREIDRLIFSQGLSTARTVTSTSGRGVGLDVVRQNVDTLGGSVDVHSRPGAGTLFTIRMPLTLAVIDGLLGQVGDETLVIPMAGLVRCLDLSASEAALADDGVLNQHGRAVPFVRLRSVFALDGGAPSREVAVIVEKGADQVGLVVDHLIGRAQIVVKPPGPFFTGLPAVSGLTILGDGRVAPILNVSGLLQDHLRRRTGAAAALRERAEIGQAHE